MIMDCDKYAGKCVCGRVHTLETRKVVVDEKAIENFETYMEELGLTGRRTAIYDEITWKLTEGQHVRADQNIILDPNGLHAEDVLIEKMMEQLDHPDVLIAVGAGTIMDFGRYPAYKLGIPFVAIPTLASSDGFTANICSAILNGQKKSTPMCAPVLVIADLDIIKGAPQRLVASGINDILAKYISMLDWRISKLVADEYFCPVVAELADHALMLMRGAADKYAATGVADHEAMTMAQMESGLTMQLLNHSRAASGAEHLMAHIVEMHPPRLEKAEGIHGECVGVGTFACIKEYPRLAGLTPKAKPFTPISEDWVREKFGDRLTPGIMKENENDVLATFDPQNIVDHWPEIKAMIDALPSVEEMEALYKACGCKYLPEHIGIDPAIADEVLDMSAAIRNRLTLIRMKRVLDFS